MRVDKYKKCLYNIFPRQSDVVFYFLLKNSLTSKWMFDKVVKLFQNDFEFAL